MPINPDKSYTRIWQLVDQFAPLSAIRRADGDTELNDIAAAMNEVSQRLLVIEAGYFYPSGNLILNPEFAVNTIGYAGDPLPLLAYGHNRWRSQAEGTAYTVTDGACTISVGAVGQLIDGRSIVTGPYTVNWEGDASCSIGGTPVAKGQTLFLVGGVDLEVLWGAGTFGFPQIAIGSAVLPFRPRPYEQELALCRRFIFLDREEAIATTHIHESITSVFAWSVGGVAAGTPRQFERSAIEPAVSPRYQSEDGGWWGYVPGAAGGTDYSTEIAGLLVSVSQNAQAILDLETGTATYKITNNARVQAVEDDAAATSTATAASISALELQAGPTGALATRLDSIEADYTTAAQAGTIADGVATTIATTIANAAVATEATARANGDSALATRLDTVEASFVVQGDIDTTVSAAVALEATARADADLALGTRVDSVEAQYTVLTDAIGALDGNFDVVQATIDASVLVETNARAAADAGLASRISTLETTVDTPSTGLVARVTTAEQALASETQARATLGNELRAEMRAGTGGSVIDDTRFRTYSSADGWQRADAQGTITVTPQPGGQELRIVVTDTQRDVVYTRSNRPMWPGVKNASAYAVEVEATLNSGSLAGAHVIVSWVNGVGGFFPATVQLNAMAGQGSGRVRYRAIFKKPNDFSGTFFYNQININANPFGGAAAKDITFHGLTIRVATPEELGSGEVGTAIATAVSAEATERTEAIADETSARVTATNALRSEITSDIAAVQAEAAAKGVVIYAATEPTTPAQRQPQNLWIDTGGSPARNRPYRWNGSAWVAVPDSGIAAAQAEAASKGRVIYAPTVPTAAADRQTQNLWIDTGGTPARNAPHRWTGAAWVAVEPAALAAATAEIAQIQSSKVDAAGAVAAVNNAVSAATGGTYASVQESVQATATMAGNAAASWGVVLDVNGRVVSLRGLNNGSTAGFAISGDLTVDGTITGAKYANSSVATEKLVFEATTRVRQQNANFYSLNQGAYSNMLYVEFPWAIRNNAVEVAVRVLPFGTPSIDYRVIVYRPDGVQESFDFIGTQNLTKPDNWLVVPNVTSPAGTVAVLLQHKGVGSINAIGLVARQYLS